MPASKAVVRGTRVHNPGPDWNHLRETVLMMELAVAQVEAAMTDSSASVDALTGTFTSMANTIRLMEDRIGGLGDDEATRETRQQLLTAAGHVGGMVRQAIIARTSTTGWPGWPNWCRTPTAYSTPSRSPVPRQAGH